MNAVAQILEPVVPILVVFAAGVVFAWRKIIDAADSRVLTEFAFRLSIPAYLFDKLAVADLEQLFQPAALITYIGTALSAGAAVAAWARLVGHHSVQAMALRVMAAVQVNTAYFAIPVLVLMFGDASPIFPILLFQVLVLTVIVIAILEHGTNTDTRHHSPIRAVTASIGRSLTTPVVLACLTGIAVNLAGYSIPAIASQSLSFVGAAAAPVALFALGLYLGGTGIHWRGATPDENALVAIKCIGFPLLMLVMVHLAGISNPWRDLLVIIAAMPAPQNTFTFAQTYDTDVDLAASTVVKTTVVSLVLLPAWMYLLR